MKTPLELREERAQVIADARKLLDKAKAENRNLNTEETAEWDKRLARAEEIKGTYERLEAQERAEASLTEPQTRSTTPNPTAGAGDKDPRTTRRSSKEYRRAFAEFLRHGERRELRGLQADQDVKGRYLVAPEQMLASVLKKADNQLSIAKMATVHKLTEAVSLGVPTLDNDPSDADWTTEIKSQAEDDTMTFGKRALNPVPIRKLVKASTKFLQHAQIDGESLVGDRLGYKFGVTKEKGFMTGTGTGQPLGLFTPSAMGISTSRDANIGANLGAVTMDKLIDAKYALRSAYLEDPSLSWLFHRTVLATVMKLKSATTGEYYWQPAIQAGQPDRLQNIPVAMSEYAPAGDGTYAGMLGCFAYYYIAEVMELAIQRLDELYAETSQVGFIGELYVDGMPALEDPFVRLKLA